MPLSAPTSPLCSDHTNHPCTAFWKPIPVDSRASCVKCSNVWPISLSGNATFPYLAYAFIYIINILCSGRKKKQRKTWSYLFCINKWIFQLSLKVSNPWIQFLSLEIFRLLPSMGDEQDPSGPEIGVGMMPVAAHNAVCAELFIFKAHSHAYLVGPKASERG